jgi:Flp pilus assembly pilin Flp
MASNMHFNCSAMLPGIDVALITTLARDDSGQDLIEYALLAGFVSLIVVGVVTNLGAVVNEIYDGINTQVAAIPGGP